MSLVIKDIPQNAGGWIKPAELKDAIAILVEVKGFDAQRPTNNGPKDSVLADVTVFNTESELDTGSPAQIIKGTRIEQTILARDLSGMVGEATIATLAQVPTKQQPAWVWRPVQGDRKDKVVKYAMDREAAIAQAVADAPSFD